MGVSSVGSVCMPTLTRSGLIIPTRMLDSRRGPCERLSLRSPAVQSPRESCSFPVEVFKDGASWWRAMGQVGRARRKSVKLLCRKPRAVGHRSRKLHCNLFIWKIQALFLNFSGYDELNRLPFPLPAGLWLLLLFRQLRSFI